MTSRSDVEERAAAREDALTEQLDEQRRLARPRDYIFDKAQEAFWDLRNGTLHSEKAVDASIPQELWRVVVEEPPARPEGARGRPPQRRERLVPPSKDIMRVENDQFVEASTWWPGKPEIIRDVFVDDGGVRPSPGARIYNRYRPPPEPLGADPEEAQRWVNHVKKLWPEQQEHEYFFDYCAHLIQCPDVKANAAIVLSGAQRIGKDAALYPVRGAIGNWNVANIEPDQLFSQFRPWLQTLMLVVNEVRPTKDEFHASSMYNILKPLIAAPPDTLPLDNKNEKLRYVINLMRVFLTTNDWMAMYIPPEDGRMFIMHSALQSYWHVHEGKPEYFAELYGWFDAGGNEAVGAWLRARDISQFNPKGALEKTSGWQAVAGTWEEPEDGVMFALSALGWPDVVFGSELANPQFDYYEEVLAMLKSPRKIGHRMQRAGYTLVKCPDDDRWRFRVGDKEFRSRLAFVKNGSGLLNGNAITAIRERGRTMLGVAVPPPGANAEPVGKPH